MASLTKLMTALVAYKITLWKTKSQWAQSERLAGQLQKIYSRNQF